MYVAYIYRCKLQYTDTWKSTSDETQRSKSSVHDRDHSPTHAILANRHVDACCKQITPVTCSLAPTKVIYKHVNATSKQIWMHHESRLPLHRVHEHDSVANVFCILPRLLALIQHAHHEPFSHSHHGTEQLHLH
jgi:hypothetical protein